MLAVQIILAAVAVALALSLPFLAMIATTAVYIGGGVFLLLMFLVGMLQEARTGDSGAGSRFFY